MLWPCEAGCHQPSRSVCESVTKITPLYEQHKYTFSLPLLPGPHIIAHIWAKGVFPTILWSMLDLRTHLLCFHFLMMFVTSTAIYKKEDNEGGRSEFTNRNKTPGNTPPNFWLEKKMTELIAQFLMSRLRRIQCGDQGDLNNYSSPRRCL